MVGASGKLVEACCWVELFEVSCEGSGQGRLELGRFEVWTSWCLDLGSKECESLGFY